MPRPIESPVRDLWLTLPYHGHGVCVTCGEPAHCAGRNPGARVCVACFEFRHHLRAPRRRP